MPEKISLTGISPIAAIWTNPWLKLLVEPE
jgi:hypothetical protein